MNQFWSGNECEILTHSQQQPQAPNAHKKESTVRLTTRITMLWRHTLSNQQAQLKGAETG